jgi:hypothetical protein
MQGLCGECAADLLAIHIDGVLRITSVGVLGDLQHERVGAGADLSDRTGAWCGICWGRINRNWRRCHGVGRRRGWCRRWHRVGGRHAGRCVPHSEALWLCGVQISLLPVDSRTVVGGAFHIQLRSVVGDPCKRSFKSFTETCDCQQAQSPLISSVSDWPLPRSA